MTLRSNRPNARLIAEVAREAHSSLAHPREVGDQKLCQHDVLAEVDDLEARSVPRQPFGDQAPVALVGRLLTAEQT